MNETANGLIVLPASATAFPSRPSLSRGDPQAEAALAEAWALGVHPGAAARRHARRDLRRGRMAGGGSRSGATGG
jgi:hypothetical protein